MVRGCGGRSQVINNFKMEKDATERTLKKSGAVWRGKGFPVASSLKEFV